MKKNKIGFEYFWQNKNIYLVKMHTKLHITGTLIKLISLCEYKYI